MPVACRGVIDLSEWKYGVSPPVNLTGEWEFYWKQLLEPQDFYDGVPVRQQYINGPQPWNGKDIEGVPIGGDGYATYRLHLDFGSQPLPAGLYGLKLLNMSSAYKLWVNDELVTSVGEVATTHEEMRPAFRPHVVTFKAGSDWMILTLQISNYHHYKGGMWNPIKLGTEEQVRQEQRKIDFFDLFILGSLLIIAFYHFGLFSLRHSDRSNLYFGLFCLVIGLRSLFYHEIAILLWLPELSWESITRIRYLSTYIAMPLFMMFVHSLYPQEFCIKILRLQQQITLLFMAVVVATPVKLYSLTMLPYQLITLVSCIYVIYVLYLAIKHKREDAWWFIGGYTTFFLVILNDILVDNYLTNSILMIPLGLLLFIFIQAFILSRRSSRTFSRIESMTKAYQRFVPKQFLAKLEKDDIVNVRPGDFTLQEMSVLFADIRSFTSMAESMTAQETFNFLNSYLGRMEPVINQHNGFIDKYLGDGIMALFDEQADNAVVAAIEMLHTLREYNSHRHNSGYRPVHIGIGINTGSMMLGTIGGHNRLEGTVISDTVNLAHRVEKLTKKYRAPLIISEHTRRALHDPQPFYSRFLDRVQVQGRKEQVAIYEVFNADPEKLRLAKTATRLRFEEAVENYHQQHYHTALNLFSRCLLQAPDDATAQVYKEWCQQKILKNTEH